MILTMTRKNTRAKRQKDKERKREAKKQALEQFVYFPVNDEWRKDIAQKLNLPMPKDSNSDTETFVSIRLSVPLATHHISPDGNCFFNALSFIITGSEEHHFNIRQMICNHLLSHEEELKVYLPAKHHGFGHEYLQESNMRTNRIWATEVEIFVAANMLDTNIFVYTKHGANWKWLQHKSHHLQNMRSIYLHHKCQNHYDVVLSVCSDPVLATFPSGMQRYFNDQLDKERKMKKSLMEQNRYQQDTEFRTLKKHNSKSNYKKDPASKTEGVKTRQIMNNAEYHRKKREYDKAKYTTDQQHRSKKLVAGKVRYRQDQVYREKKKKTLQEQQKQKYHNDRMYRETIKRRNRVRYRMLRIYQLQKKISSRTKYSTNPLFRKSVRKYQSLKYKKFKEQMKLLFKSKYRNNIDFQRKGKDASKSKYRNNKAFQRKVKDASKSKYRNNKAFQRKVKDASKSKYRNNKAFQRKVKDASKSKYRNNKAFQRKVKDASKSKYKKNKVFQRKVKDASKSKYKSNIAFQREVKNASKSKYRNDTDFHEKVKLFSKTKYKQNISFCHTVKASSIKRYSSNALFRSRVKHMLRQQYKTSRDIRSRKKQNVRRKRRCINSAIQSFRKQTDAVPKYVCTVCVRSLYRNQVKVCKRPKYMNNNICEEVAEKCLTGKFIHTCSPGQCEEPCTMKWATKEWICYTCDRHLSVGNIPPQAQANGLQLQPIPKELLQLNTLEKQLVALRIPFMKLLSLPRGGQKGVKGQMVNVPSDLSSITKTLPRTIDDAQLVRVKLKRKLAYKGHHQYEWVNPNHVIDAIKYLAQNNSYYEGIVFSESWFDPSVDSDIVKETQPESDSEDDQESQKLPDNIQEHQNDSNKEDCDEGKPLLKQTKKVSKSATEESYPVETCFQPLDLGQEFLDTNDRVFCIAPGEGHKPQNVFQEKGADVMSFPVLHPDGRFGFHADREINISPSKYFNARLFSADDRFARDNNYIFFAQYMVEMNNIRSNISVALRKGKQSTDDGKNITASMLTDSENLRKFLKADTGYRFLQPVRGTPPYWQRTLKDLYAMIRQIGIPTWFVTFSAGETRWEEVICTLKKDDKRPPAEIEWTEKCQMIRENPVLCARLFSNRVQALFSHLIMSPAQPIGNVVDYFYRTEFQQRGSPHIHCLFWVKDAPKLNEDTDDKICRFVDKYISCQLPDQETDPELFDIVSSVQIHNKAHTKSCRKKGTACRFNFPRHPVLQTFIARAESSEEEIPYIPEKDRKMPTREEFEEQIKNHSRSARQIIKDVWIVINNTDDIEEASFANVLKRANVTYEQFKESIELVTTKNTIFHKRNMADCWVNHYNPHLLRAWNANLDIQYVMDAYSCVAYILSYISKAEMEVGELLSNAQNEARDGNKDAAAAMRHIGQAYIQNREVSAQEAVYRVCGMHLKECSRDVVFIPTGQNTIKMSLPINILKSRHGNDKDENIWMTSVTDKYYQRPEELDDICLAEFCSLFTVLPKSRPPKKSAKSLPVYHLKKDLGYLKRRTPGKEAVIRYPRFNRLKNPEEFYLTLIQLYVPHNAPVLRPSAFHSYEEYVQRGIHHGESLTDIISEKRHHFEVDAEDLEKAWDDMQDGKVGEDAWAQIAPQAESERLDGENENNLLDELHPEDNPDLAISDSHDKQQKTKNQRIEYHKPNIPLKKIYEDLRAMNKQQQTIFYKVRDWALNVSWKKHPEPFHAFVTGGAGTGKSHLIKCIYHETTRILAKAKDDPDAVSVLLTAPTGTAAFNIGGMTIHSALAISKTIRLPYTPLGENILNTLRAKFNNLQILIIDEISMVDHKILTYIHGRLCQLKQSKKPFGNISILAVGDFYQLPPVRASPLYKVKDSIILDLWNSHFSIAHLSEVMRQKEDSDFAAMLNRLRVHKRGEKLMKEDLDTLKSLSCDKTPDDFRNALHIFPTNREVAAHNDSTVHDVCKPCFTVTAKDFARSSVNGQLIQKEQPLSTSSSEDLLDTIKLGVHARIMLLRNIDTEDGLVNGAFGTVAALEQSQSGEVKAVYVKFDNKLCGVRNISNSTIPGSEGAVRITPVEEALSHKNVVRRQFPLKLGWAATIHKVQGMTTKNIVVSLKSVFQAGMAYVALSRTNSLHGLRILDLDTSVIYASEEIKQSLENMSKFLPEPAHPLDTGLKVVLHNTQGIIPNADNIRKGDVFKDADVVCFTETWLNKTKYLPPTLLSTFDFHILNRESAYSLTHGDLASKERGGVAMFLQTTIEHSRCDFHVDNIEYVSVLVQMSQPLSITTVYRPPCYPLVQFSDALQALLTAIEEYKRSSCLKVVVGDFNDNHFHDNPRTSQIFKQCGFHQLVNTPTTEAGTCLDLVFVKGFTDDPKVEVQPIYYSFHDMVIIRIDNTKNN